MNTSPRKKSIPRLRPKGELYSLDVNGTKVVMTEQKVSENELPYVLKKKLLLLRPEILKAALTYIPCWFVEIDFDVTMFSKSSKRSGRLQFVVDEKKGCSVLEPGYSVKFMNKDVDTEKLVDHKLTQEQAEKKAVVDARWKVIMGKFKRVPELSIKRTKKFYRPYFEVETTFGNKVSTQWVPADGNDNYFTYQ